MFVIEKLLMLMAYSGTEHVSYTIHVVDTWALMWNHRTTILFDNALAELYIWPAWPLQASIFIFR